MTDSQAAARRPLSIVHLFRPAVAGAKGTLRAVSTVTARASRVDLRQDEAQADFDERAAIREFDGGQPRAEAEARARAETARAIDDADRADDAQALLRFLVENGPATYGAAAMALGWPATRAWRAEAALMASGMIRHVRPTGKAEAVPEASP